MHRFNSLDHGASIGLETYGVVDVTFFSGMLPLADGASFLVLRGCSKALWWRYYRMARGVCVTSVQKSMEELSVISVVLVASDYCFRLGW